uniref:COG3014 family protein n=1 Tax=Aliarcobacter sp. TaxID=2321116 RepID=UPI0040488080
MIYLKSLILGSSILFFSGCTAAVTGHSKALDDFNIELLSGKCDYQKIDEKIDDDPILWGEQGGSLVRNCMNYAKSNELFEKVEAVYKEDIDKDSILSNAQETVTSALVNNNLNDYEGNTYEKVMVNTYKALNYVSLNDHENARIEFNRALDRQRRAKDYFEKDIKNKKEELQKKELEEQSKIKKKDNEENISFSEVAMNKQTQEIIYSKYNSALNDFQAYPDFINPFTTYMSGVYFLLNGDRKKANDLLKESLRMDPKNLQIKNDFNLSKKRKKENYVWVIYENGMGMTKNEMRFDIPLFLFSSKVMYTGIVLPEIKENRPAYPYLVVNDNKTIEICNMDNVIKTEFKKKFPMLVTEAVINTVTKTYAQYELNRQVGPLGGLAGALYQGLTNKADVRTWSALPKNFQSIRVKVDGKPLVIKNHNNEVISTLNLPSNKSALIYVRSQVEGNNKIHEIIF